MVGENRKIEMRTQEKTVDRLVLLRLYWWKFRPFSITGANGPCRPDGESAHHLRGKLWDPFSTKMVVSRFCDDTTDAPACDAGLSRNTGEYDKSCPALLGYILKVKDGR